MRQIADVFHDILCDSLHRRPVPSCACKHLTPGSKISWKGLACSLVVSKSRYKNSLSLKSSYRTCYLYARFLTYRQANRSLSRNHQILSYTTFRTASHRSHSFRWQSNANGFFFIRASTVCNNCLTETTSIKLSPSSTRCKTFSRSGRMASKPSEQPGNPGHSTIRLGVKAQRTN